VISGTLHRGPPQDHIQWNFASLNGGPRPLTHADKGDVTSPTPSRSMIRRRVTGARRSADRNMHTQLRGVEFTRCPCKRDKHTFPGVALVMEVMPGLGIHPMGELGGDKLTARKPQSDARGRTSKGHSIVLTVQFPHFADATLWISLKGPRQRTNKTARVSHNIRDTELNNLPARLGSHFRMTRSNEIVLRMVRLGIGPFCSIWGPVLEQAQ